MLSWCSLPLETHAVGEWGHTCVLGPDEGAKNHFSQIGRCTGAAGTRFSDRLRRSADGVNSPKGNSETKRRRGGTALRSSASQNGPFGLCQAESFGNSFADSVSFRLPSWQNLDGHPAPPANCAPGYANPRRKSAPTRKIRKGQAAHKPVPLTLRHVQSPAT